MSGLAFEATPDTGCEQLHILARGVPGRHPAHLVIRRIPVPEEAEVFQFKFTKDGEEYGTVTASIDGLHKLCIYFSDEVADSEKEETHGEDESWYKVLNQLKRFAQKYQLSFELKNVDHLKHDMAKREYMKKQERISDNNKDGITLFFN